MKVREILNIQELNVKVRVIDIPRLRPNSKICSKSEVQL
jgi:hypothetical protein